jgi:hypothetical protein
MKTVKREKLRRITAIIVSVLLLLNMLSFPVLADEVTVTTEIRVGEAEAGCKEVGDIISIPVSLRGNPGINGYGVQVRFDNEKLEYIRTRQEMVVFEDTIMFARGRPDDINMRGLTDITASNEYMAITTKDGVLFTLEFKIKEAITTDVELKIELEDLEIKKPGTALINSIDGVNHRVPFTAVDGVVFGHRYDEEGQCECGETRPVPDGIEMSFGIVTCEDVTEDGKIAIPVMISGNTRGYGIEGYQARIKFDPQELRFESAEQIADLFDKTDFFFDGMLSGTDNIINIHGANKSVAKSYKEKGTIFNLVFEVQPDVKEFGLSFESAQISFDIEKNQTANRNGISARFILCDCDIGIFCEICEEWNCEKTHVPCENPDCDEYDCDECEKCGVCEEWNCEKTHVPCENPDCDE